VTVETRVANNALAADELRLNCTISRGDVAVHVVRAREELVAARAAREVLG
jgi:hypothetical protein